jgi:hypothetical protein
MAASVDPERIPREGFERDGILYEYTDILREVVIGEETKTHTEAETIDAANDDIETVLGILPMTKEVTTDDGFFGVLHLSTSTLKSEISGYGSSSKTVSVSRSYPNLATMDSQHIPKSVSEGGINYALRDIQWQTDNTYNVDDYEIGDRYTATAIYDGSKSSSYVKGYKITAEYIGEVCRTGVSVIRYTVIYSGTAVPTPSPAPEPTPEPTPEIPSEEQDESGFNGLLLVIPLALLAAGSTGGFLYMYLKNRKETNIHEETTDYADADDSVDSDDDRIDPDDGGRL